jgi:hypothetical protein
VVGLSENQNFDVSRDYREVDGTRADTEAQKEEKREFKTKEKPVQQSGSKDDGSEMIRWWW